MKTEDQYREESIEQYKRMDHYQKLMMLERLAGDLEVIVSCDQGHFKFPIWVTDDETYEEDFALAVNLDDQEVVCRDGDKQDLKLETTWIDKVS